MSFFDPQRYVGMKLEEAVEKVKSFGFTIRLQSKDGVPMVRTCDINRHRINVSVIDGVITEVHNIG